MERSHSVTPAERSLSRAEIRELTALAIKKYRNERGRTIAEGEQLVAEALVSAWSVHEVVATPQFIASKGMIKLFPLMAEREVALRSVPEEVLKKVSELATSPGVLATVSPPVWGDKPFRTGVVLALDRISDPVNLGSIARTACFYGIERLLLSEECVDVLNPRALRASMGGLFFLTILTTKSLKNELRKLQHDGAKIVVADAVTGTDVQLNPSELPMVLVMGSEAHGIRPEIIEIADYHWRLNPIGRDLTLNVAAATAILLDRFSRMTARSIPRDFS